MVNAYCAGTIVAIVAGAIGWFMVLRRQSFAGHTLAVVSFPGAAGAILLGVSASYGYFAAAIGCALVISLVPRSTAGRAFSNESAVIGTVQAFALACGALFVSLYGGFLDSLTGLLFGTFLGVSDTQVATLLVVGAAALAVLAVLARPLLFATVDPDVAQARGRARSRALDGVLGPPRRRRRRGQPDHRGALGLRAPRHARRRGPAAHRAPRRQLLPHARVRARRRCGSGLGFAYFSDLPGRLLRDHRRVRVLRAGVGLARGRDDAALPADARASSRRLR